MLIKTGLLTIALTAVSIFAEDINLDVTTKLQSKLSLLNQNSKNKLIKRHLTSLSNIYKIEEIAQSLNKNDKEIKKFNKGLKQCLEWLPEEYAFKAITQGNNRLIFSFVSKFDHTIQTYALRLPQNYDKNKTYPLIVILHGMGPSNQFSFISYEFKKKFNTEKNNKIEAFSLEPFGRGNNYYQGLAEKDIFEAIDDMKKYFKVNEDKTYLMGQSMGGGGTWNIATRTPDYWAAIAANSPAFTHKSAPWLASNLAGVPVRFWYGGKDKPHYGENAKLAHEELQKLGFSSELHTSPKAGHGLPPEESFEITKWLLKHERVIPKEFSFTAFSSIYAGKNKKRVYIHRGRNGITMLPNYNEEIKLKSFTCHVDKNIISINTKNCSELQFKPEGLKIKGDYTIILNGGKVFEGNKKNLKLIIKK